jgi:hypothetical protein
MGTRLACEHAGCGERGDGSAAVKDTVITEVLVSGWLALTMDPERAVCTVCQGGPGGRGCCSDLGVRGR